MAKTKQLATQSDCHMNGDISLVEYEEIHKQVALSLAPEDTERVVLLFPVQCIKYLFSRRVFYHNCKFTQKKVNCRKHIKTQYLHINYH